MNSKKVKKNKKKKSSFKLLKGKSKAKGKKGKKGKKGSPGFLTLLLTTTVFFIIASIAFESFQERDFKEPTISELVTSINGGEVSAINVAGIKVEVEYADETKGVLRKDNFTAFEETLINLGVEKEALSQVSYNIVRESGTAFWLKNILPFIFPLLILLVFIWFLTKQGKGLGGMQVFQFGKSKARFISPDNKNNRITFKDVAGATEAKEELEEFVQFLKHPDKFIAIGAKVPKGVLLSGAPGTGKTLLARAVAGEARVPFFSISGSEFVEMFVGVGASRVRDLFSVAKKSSPAIIFIDEIDAVGRTRGSGLGGGNDEREQALNQILVEMDGFEQIQKVVVIASTNRPDILDSALTRPGRFDRKIVIALPDIKERKAILEVHARGKNLEKDVNLEIVARRTPGLSGADLASVVNEAGILAVRVNRKSIQQIDLLSAIEKVLFGPERKGRVITEHERKVIAYHESGHALLASLLPYADPVQKITIVSRGHAGGYVLAIPDTDRQLKTKAEFIDTITMALGGYTVEEMFFKDVSTGPSSDLSMVSNLAHDMVTKFGMSSSIGPIVLRRDRQGFIQSRERHSDNFEDLIDREVEKIIKSAHKTAKDLISKNKKVLIKVAEKLLEVETLEREEYEALLKKEGIVIRNELGK